ncbi:carbohydrate kinase family protein [Pseudaminobacter soli (ex Li et al. 2025)]|uniref:Carbohydrate kinase family protein n=1 Tax=Pseudaminobacter soli (ex Li et al. 2025) TaxID=1295366 RepID=A0A2P7SKM4_9HYPH|nr:sugar kinase [Mesorhizobium soli]PSJ63046.1 carbohydrate kinase family protein [Mesorhizobium soli]
MPAVAILGDINVDLTLQVAAYPPEGGEGIAERQMHGIGGSATNTALILARLGQPVRFIGRTGADAWGDWCTVEMAAAGIDTRWISRDAEEPTQLNIVVVGASGERTMFSYRGANVKLGADDVKPAALAETALLHLSGYALLKAPQSNAALRAVDLARTANIPITLDIPSGIAGAIGPAVTGLLPEIDTLFLGELDAKLLGSQGQQATLDAAAHGLIEAGATNVVIKRGAEGSVLYRKGQEIHSPAVKVDVIDTTGAGDAFAAGYIFGSLAGLSVPATGALANVAGAIAASNLGPSASAVSRDALLDGISKAGIDPSLLAEIQPQIRR